MTETLLTAGFIVDPAAGTVTDKDGNICKLRPKSFQLLMYFIASSHQVLSKEHILNEVWSGVVVGEHVVFQSVKEIRELFSPQVVLRTIPKQGYSWIAGIEQCPPANPVQPRGKGSWFSPVQTILVGCCIVLAFALFWLGGAEKTAVTGSIVVLPVKNRLDDNSHDWVKLGAMDQLSHRLASSDNRGVLHTDYVLEVMKRAGVLNQDINKTAIERIFMVSGASVIIEMTLSGMPREYRLSYTLHRRYSSLRGVIFSSQVVDAIEQVAQRISRQTGIALQGAAADYRSDFANELIANALTAQASGDPEKTIQLLRAAIASEPQNLTAKRLLLQIRVEQKAFAESTSLANQALAQIESASTPNTEHVRALFWAALNELQQRQFHSATPLLARAESIANELHDWLYLANIAEIRGQIAQFHQQYEQAQDFYQDAINYHKVLDCPHGESNGLLNLSKLAVERGAPGLAHRYYNEAMALIKQRQLSQLQKVAEAWFTTQAPLTKNNPLVQ